MSISPIDKILSSVSNEMRMTVIDEWSAPGEPFEVYYRPVTLAVKQKIQKHAKGNDQASSVYTLIFMACDNQGNNLFTVADKSSLMNNVPSKQIDQLALIMLDIETADSLEK